ncbi:hypothetical protein V8G54_010462 [Vigna mungo]|uniref:Transmembrane protein n=1 Tax=Vigna mungo TaxID=3915 RepID=A0AAQ3NX37_VIGMU
MNYNISIIIWDIYSIVQLFLSFHFPCNQTRGKKKLSFSLLSLFSLAKQDTTLLTSVIDFGHGRNLLWFPNLPPQQNNGEAGFSWLPMAAALCMVVGASRTCWRKSIVDKEIISSKWKRLCSNGWEKRWKLQKLNCIFQCCVF